MDQNRPGDRGDDRASHAPADGTSGMTAIPIEDDAETASPAESDARTPGSATVCVVGLGYVGLPLAVAFDEAGQSVVGFDVDEEKVDALTDGEDPTGDLGDGAVADADAEFTTDATDIARADYVIVTVPTPIDDSENPDLAYVRAAGETVGEHMSTDTTVVLESTVFPGATEDVLVPELAGASGYTRGEDFHVGYSPERASPGEEGRGVRDVVKIVGANDDAVRERLAALYSSIVDAGVYRAPDIETAETAKVIENVQRDLNIALVNELAIACEHIGLDTEEVLDAARTKWNFHDEYSPGLVGGHCIPVDPHYLAHRSEREGFSPALVLKAREINERVPAHVADLTVKALNDTGNVLRDSSVLLLGLSYKPDVGDIRTSEVDGVADELAEFGVDVAGYDPHAPEERARETFELTVQSSFNPTGYDGLVVTTAHEEFEAIDFDQVAEAMADDPVIVDAAGAFDEERIAEAGFRYRQL